MRQRSLEIIQMIRERKKQPKYRWFRPPWLLRGAFRQTLRTSQLLRQLAAEYLESQHSVAAQ